MNEQYASGPFCPVLFLLDRGELRTYTYRAQRAPSPPGSLVNTLSSLCDDRRFSNVFVDTEFCSVR